MGVGSGEQGGCGAPWIFTHGTNIVNKGFSVIFRPFLLFLVFFPFLPTLWKRLNSRIFRSFFAILRSFFLLAPLEIFLPAPLVTLYIGFY